MSRPRAACGTRGAYERHIRLKEPVDAACRAVQRETDAARSSSASARSRGQVGGRPQLPAPRPIDVLARRRDDAKAALRAGLLSAVAAIDDEGIYDAIDRLAEVEDLLDEWLEISDRIDHPWAFKEDGKHADA